ncbi:hypothetical protein BKA67DRAFT_527583 [Truncatella angustata]|uniref:Cyclin-D1-binding protein 1-like N-terminal domain-containing protein n=1 Tax=Truncatella angustata TaxID=152316 RepID=A0A9P8UB59_9PEZI|nr:uncharacterized protein BKA67DRAFT_527583 [Truncatella angustata]KAH6645006.1 hypothetical protein BKA67DRAFT_527583 [Truncatella angustata]KAH8201058.1 hypothetical protein TruAng_004754 [Truncatella angustata]
MPSPQAAAGTLDGLRTLVRTSATLIKQLEEVVHQSALGKADAAAPPSPSTAPPPSVDAFSLAHDSASLIRAHSTKLSLLIINEPYTPSAIAKVLQELVAGPVPGIASAVQVCAADRYTAVVRQDLAWRCYRVLKELRGLVEIIPLDGRVLSAEKKDGARGDKGSLTATGVIWSACDDVILLRKLGVAGLLVKKVQQYRDTLQDVLDELKEWKEEGEEQEEDDADEVEYVSSQLDTTHLTDQDMVDDLMNTRHIPRDDQDKIGQRLESCLKRLRLTTLLYTAVVKRRFKTLPPLPGSEPTSVAKRLDEVLAILKQLPDHFNDLACAFYELEPDAIDQNMDTCFFDAFAASEMLMKPWDGDKDEFTEWAQKFQVSIKKPD